MVMHLCLNICFNSVITEEQQHHHLTTGLPTTDFQSIHYMSMSLWVKLSAKHQLTLIVLSVQNTKQKHNITSAGTESSNFRYNLASHQYSEEHAI